MNQGILRFRNKPCIPTTQKNCSTTICIETCVYTPTCIPSGNQTWQWKGSFNRKITDKCSIFHCHVWLPEGSDGVWSVVSIFQCHIFFISTFFLACSRGLSEPFVGSCSVNYLFLGLAFVVLEAETCISLSILLV